jgi:tetratricopeptide (TPR) repeat protein
MKHRKPRETSAALVAALCGVAFFGAVGCGTGPDPATAAGVATGPGAAVAGQGDLGTPQPGQQWTMNDAGSGQGIGQDRPVMNEEATNLTRQATEAFQRGELAAAKTLYAQATQADSKAYQAYYSLGVVQELLREPGALDSYRQAYTVVPDYEPAIVAWAGLTARKGQIGEADSFLTQRHNQFPKSAAILAALAEVKSTQKDTASAQKMASEALKLNPAWTPAMVTIARDHYRSRRIDLALYALQAILDGFEPVDINPPRDKENADARLLRGLIFKEQGKRKEAMDDFQAALAKRPDLVEARVNLATYLLEAGNASAAKPLVEGALRFDSEQLQAHLILADCYRLLGSPAEAKQKFEYVLSRDAGLYQVHYNLGLLYLFAPNIPGMTPMQQVEAATSSLKKFQELRPKNESDDSDELLNRAKLKKGELEAAAAAAAEPPPAPPAAPAAGGEAGGGASPPAANDGGGTPPPAEGDE